MKRLIRVASLTAYHVSKNNFDKFDWNKAVEGGNGIGNAMYGCGLYFLADKNEVSSISRQLGEGEKYLYTVTLNCNKNQMINLETDNQSDYVIKKINSLINTKAKEHIVDEIQNADSAEKINNILTSYDLDGLKLSVEEDNSDDMYNLFEKYCQEKNIQPDLGEIEKVMDEMEKDEKYSNLIQKMNDNTTNVSSEEKQKLIKTIENSKFEVDAEMIIDMGNIYEDLQSFYHTDPLHVSKMLNEAGIYGAIKDTYYIMFNDDITITNKELVK